MKVAPIIIQFLFLLFLQTNLNGQLQNKTIRSLWDQFETDWENENARACADIYLEDGVHIPPQYTINIGREKVFEFYSLLFKNHLSSDYNHTIDKIDLVSENQIVELGHFTVDWIRNDSSTWTFNARSLTHWMKQPDGNWYVDKFVFNNPVDQEDISELETKWKTAEKEQKILEQNLLLTKGQAQRNYLLAGLGGLALLLFGFYNRNKYKQRLAAERITSLEQGQRIIALDFMVQGQEKERKRIAQELHDGLGGLLSSAKLLLKKFQGQEEVNTKNELFNQAESVINTAHTEVRRISHDMMPGALIDLGLMDALEDLVSVVERDNNLKIDCTFPRETLQFSDVQSIHLYRIFQEVINNSIKHSNASKIEIEMIRTNNYLELTISDNGKGFDYEVAKKQGGLGLKNIESRVKYLKGKMELSTSSEYGSSYLIEIPI